MSSLFIVMLGGRHARANTEVHDVVLAVGDTLEEIYPQLKNAWFGEQQGLHIDAWQKLQVIEFENKTYQIRFSDAQPNLLDAKLWLINLGGYDVNEFGELHRYVLVVAQDACEAKSKGKQHFANHWQKQHTDRVLDIDDCIAIDHVYGRYVELIEVDTKKDLSQLCESTWENTYLTI